MRRLLSLIMPGALALSLSSCLEDKEAKAQLEAMEEELAIAKEDLSRAYEELDAVGEIEVELEDAAAKVEELEQSLEEKGEFEEKARTLEEDLKKVREEFDAYQKKYEAKVRNAGIGETMASLKVGDRELLDVVIKEVGPSEVKVTHANGFATFDAETAPAEWRERFFLRTPAEIEERETALAALLNPEPEPTEEELRNERPVSSYQQKRNEMALELENLKQLASKVEPCVVLIEGNGGKGTGFFAREGITTYLYTAAHVLDRNTGLKITDTSGREWREFGDLEVAKEADLVRLPVKIEVLNALEIRSSDEELVSGEMVAAFGNADGAGVVTKVDGKIRGVGPDNYEVSSGVVQGNSGGPVVLADAQAIAVVTHLLDSRDDIWAEDTPSARVRRFACRIDRKREWQKVSLATFLNTQVQIDNYDRITRLIFALATLRPTTKGLLLDQQVGGSQTVLDILEENEDLKVVSDLIAMNRELQAKKTGVSDSDLRRKFGNFYQSIMNHAKKQQLSNGTISEYHRAEAEASLEWRKDALEAMNEAYEYLRG